MENLPIPKRDLEVLRRSKEGRRAEEKKIEKRKVNGKISEKVYEDLHVEDNSPRIGS